MNTAATVGFALLAAMGWVGCLAVVVVYVRFRKFFPIQQRGYSWSILSAVTGLYAYVAMVADLLTRSSGGMSCWPTLIMSITYQAGFYGPVLYRGAYLASRCRRSDLLAVGKRSHWLWFTVMSERRVHYMGLVLVFVPMVLACALAVVNTRDVEAFTTTEADCSSPVAITSIFQAGLDTFLLFVLIGFNWGVSDAYFMKKELAVGGGFIVVLSIGWAAVLFSSAPDEYRFYFVIPTIITGIFWQMAYPLYVARGYTTRRKHMKLCAETCLDREMSNMTVNQDIKTLTLTDVLQNNALRAIFYEYCKTRWCLELLLFRDEVQAYEIDASTDNRRARRDMIISEFVENGSRLQINISGVVATPLLAARGTQNVDSDLFREAVKTCETVLSQDVLSQWVLDNNGNVAVAREASFVSLTVATV